MFGAAILAAAITFTPLTGLDPGNYIALDANSITDYYRDALIDNGWHGIPDDGGEFIYVPRQVALQLCGSDSDCEQAEYANVAVTVWAI